jgi:hypothetical protein
MCGTFLRNAADDGARREVFQVFPHVRAFQPNENHTFMTRTQTPTTDTVALNGADLAEAIDQFIRGCHDDLADGTRAYTLVTPAGPVDHFDVKVATATLIYTEIVAGEVVDGVTLLAGDRVLHITDEDGSAGIWQVAASGPPSRPTDCDTVEELVAKPYVRVTAGTLNAGRWYLIDDDSIIDIELANYTIVPQ